MALCKYHYRILHPLSYLSKLSDGDIVVSKAVYRSRCLYRISAISYILTRVLLIELLLPKMSLHFCWIYVSHFSEWHSWRLSSFPTNSIYLSQPFVWYESPIVIEPEKTKVADIPALT